MECLRVEFLPRGDFVRLLLHEGLPADGERVARFVAQLEPRRERMILILRRCLERREQSGARGVTLRVIGKLFRQRRALAGDLGGQARTLGLLFRRERLGNGGGRNQSRPGAERRFHFFRRERAIVNSRLLNLPREESVASTRVPLAEQHARGFRREGLQLLALAGWRPRCAVGHAIAEDRDAVVRAIDDGEVNKFAGLGGFLRGFEILAAPKKVAAGHPLARLFLGEDN